MFYANGIRSVRVDSVGAGAGVAESTVHEHFPTKDDLVLAYLTRADDAWQGKLRAAARAAGDDPRVQLVGLFDALEEACARTGYRGCAFINTAAEAAPGSVVHGATVSHKRAVRSWVAELARAAGAADPAGLAQSLTVVLDGALAATALEPRPDLVTTARLVARTLVESACPASPGGPIRQREGER